MSKKLKLFVMMLTCILLSINQVLATEEVAYTLTAAATGSNSSPHNSYGDAATGWSCTDANDVTISWAVIGNSYMVPWRIGVKKGTAAGSNTRYIYSETAISQNITKVIVTHGAKSGFTAVSVTLRVYSTAAKAATGGDGDISNVSVAYADNTTMTFNRPTGHNWTGRFYRLDYDLTWSYKKNDPQYILFSSAVFKYESGGSTKTVSYAAGDGSGTNPGSHTGVTPGSSITLKDNTFTAPAGKQFAGWNDGSTTRAAGTSYTVTDDVTMTAVWECITPTISSQSIANATYTVGQSPANLSVTASGGTLSYQWKQCATENGTYVNVTGGTGGTTATYTPPTSAASDLWYQCTVTNTGSSCNTTVTSNKAHIVVSPASSWKFKYSGDDYDPHTMTEDAGVASYSISLAADSRYEFGFDDNGSAFYKNNGTMVATTSGWTFNTSDNNCKIHTGPAGTYTFAINTTSKAVTVTYPDVTHPNDHYVYFKNSDVWGTVYGYLYNTGNDNKAAAWPGSVMAATTTICGETYHYAALNAMNGTYNSIKFNDGGSGYGHETSALSTTSSLGKFNANRDANWHDFKYSITFAGNGNTGGSMTNVSNICIGNDQTLASNGYTKSHNHFTGWTANVDVKIGGETVTAGTLIANGATIQDIQQNIALTAQWEINSHTLTWNWGGGSTTSTTHTAAGTLNYGVTITYPADNTMSRDGYVFTGWSSNPGTMPDNDLTITAQWAPKVVWMAGGAVFNTQYGAAGTALTDPGTPSNSTYCDGVKVFVGWSASTIDGTTDTEPGDLFTSVAGKTIPAGGTTYYAVFATSAGELSNSYAAITSGLETANYVIAYSYNGGTPIVLKNAADNSSPSDKLEGYNLSLSASKYSNPGASYIWELQAQPDGSYYIYNANADKYVNATTSTLTLSTTPTKFTISYDGTNSRWTIQIKDNSTYYVHGYVNSTAYDFRVSTSGSGNRYRIYLYKQESNITYSAYATTCSTEPRLNVTPTSLDFGNVANGTYKELTFSLTGSYLTANASIGVSGTNSSYFSVTPSSVEKGAGTIAATDITVRYTPGAVGDGHTATVTVSSTGADNKTVTLTGNCKASYTVTCSPASNGSVLANKTSNVMAGETVTLTISPSSGYQLSSISAVDGSSNPVSLSGTGNSRTFEMPASNVTVTAAFVVRTDYVLVESALDDYSGEYLIVYHSMFDSFYALSGRSGNKDTNGHGDVTNVTDYYDSGSKSIESNATTDAMKMIIEPAETDDRYTIYWEYDATYLAMTASNTGTGEKLRFITSANLTSSNSYEWGISLVSETTKHRLSLWNNAATPARYDLQYNTSTSDFRIYQNSQVHPELYKKVETCSKLAAPTGLTESSVTQTTCTLSWNAVEHASGYEVSLDGGSNWTSTGTNRTYNVLAGAGWTQGNTYTWKVRATGDGSTYCDKGTVASHTVTMKAAVRVTYNGNGHTSGQYPVTGGYVDLTEGDSYTILGNTGNGGSPLAKTGYVFDGWHNSSTYSATPYYTIGGSITVNANTILYANWKPKKDTFVDAVHNTATQYGEGYNYTIPSCSDQTRHTSGTCEETHYKFIGWALAGADLSNPSNIIHAGDQQTATGTDASPRTYYAVWAEEL